MYRVMLLWVAVLAVAAISAVGFVQVFVISDSQSSPTPAVTATARPRDFQDNVPPATARPRDFRE